MVTVRWLCLARPAQPVGDQKQSSATNVVVRQSFSTGRTVPPSAFAGSGLSSGLISTTRTCRPNHGA